MTAVEQTVRRVFVVLEALAASAEPRRVSDLAAQLGLAKPVVHRALTALVALGYATQDLATFRYAATLKLYEVGRRLVAESNLHTATAEAMRELAESSGESVALGSCDHGEMVFLASAEGSQALKATAPIGSRSPALETAIGKAILAFQGPEALDQALAHAKRMTRTSITTRARAEAELRNVRRTGHAIDDGEFHESIGAVASPVRDASDNVVAAICVWGARDRILGEARERIVGLVVEAASRVSRRLGASASLDGVTAPSAGSRVPSGASAKSPARRARRGAAVRQKRMP